MSGLREAQIALREAAAAWDEVGWQPTAILADDPLRQAAYNLRKVAEQTIAALAASWTVEDTCQVGDADPTPRDALGRCCGAGDQGWVCTRYANHPGRQHVAGDNEHVKHVWPWSTGVTPDKPVPAGIADAFTSAEREALVRTAAEAVCGDLGGISSEQLELAERAYALLQQEIGGEEP